jgi:hypothetical protein
MAQLQPNFFFQQAGAPPHQGLTVTGLWIKLFLTDGLGWMDQSLGPLASPI